MTEESKKKSHITVLIGLLNPEEQGITIIKTSIQIHPVMQHKIP